MGIDWGRSWFSPCTGATREDGVPMKPCQDWKAQQLSASVLEFTNCWNAFGADRPSWPGGVMDHLLRPSAERTIRPLRCGGHQK